MSGENHHLAVRSPLLLFPLFLLLVFCSSGLYLCPFFIFGISLQRSFSSSLSPPFSSPLLLLIHCGTTKDDSLVLSVKTTRQARLLITNFLNLLILVCPFVPFFFFLPPLSPPSFIFSSSSCLPLASRAPSSASYSVILCPFSIVNPPRSGCKPLPQPDLFWSFHCSPDPPPLSPPPLLPLLVLSVCYRFLSFS